MKALPFGSKKGVNLWMIVSIKELVFIHYPLNSIECAHYIAVLYFPQGAHREIEKTRWIGNEKSNMEASNKNHHLHCSPPGLQCEFSKEKACIA